MTKRRRFGEDEKRKAQAQTEQMHRAIERAIERDRRKRMGRPRPLESFAEENQRRQDDLASANRSRMLNIAPEPVYDEPSSPVARDFSRRLDLLENAGADYTPEFLDSDLSTLARPGKITKVTVADGPPSAHLYEGVYMDGATEIVDGEEQEETWKTASADINQGDQIQITWATASLQALGGKNLNVVQLPLAVDDYVLVMAILVDMESRQSYPPLVVKQPVGLAMTEMADFIVA